MRIESFTFRHFSSEFRLMWLVSRERTVQSNRFLCLLLHISFSVLSSLCSKVMTYFDRGYLVLFAIISYAPFLCLLPTQKVNIYNLFRSRHRPKFQTINIWIILKLKWLCDIMSFEMISQCKQFAGTIKTPHNQQSPLIILRSNNSLLLFACSK